MTLADAADVVVYDASPNTSFQQVFNAMINDGDTVISNSWAQCEDQTQVRRPGDRLRSWPRRQPSGISVFNGAGDTGSTCLDGSPNTVAVPADSPTPPPSAEAPTSPARVAPTEGKAGGTDQRHASDGPRRASVSLRSSSRPGPTRTARPRQQVVRFPTSSRPRTPPKASRSAKQTPEGVQTV